MGTTIGPTMGAAAFGFDDSGERALEALFFGRLACGEAGESGGNFISEFSDRGMSVPAAMSVQKETVAVTVSLLCGPFVVDVVWLCCRFVLEDVLRIYASTVSLYRTPDGAHFHKRNT